ncbi:uncharacterized protein LOC128406836 isoform X2 [Podarcis raffonei]|uniref:uncharacterized protein LOC128406836 isoform X2 n=1 Tax=Podarcis raffonei TaxID=65483 RepID=UPI0023297358|nr:uncharacterized protein LOC128406836 isoform X2 [Podarcis raffonei]
MWPIWSMQLEKASCDLGFTEAINKRMQVPSRLKVAEDPSAGDLQGATPKDFSPSYQMHIPDRILVAEMTTNAAVQPHFLSQLSHQPPILEEPLLEPTIQPAIYGEHPFLTFISGPGSPRRKRLAEAKCTAPCLLYPPASSVPFGGQDLLPAECPSGAVVPWAPDVPAVLQAWPSPMQFPAEKRGLRELSGGLRHHRGSGNEEAADEDRRAASAPGEAAYGLAPEGAVVLLCAGLFLPYQHVALAQKMRKPPCSKQQDLLPAVNLVLVSFH